MLRSRLLEPKRTRGATDRPPGLRYLRWATALAIGVAWLHFLAPTGLGGPVGLVWVSGTSMEPTMQTGDLAIVYRSAQYEVGDIVAFEIPEGGTVIHRIVERTADGYRFQGDHRDFPDPWLLGDEAITGREVATIPHAADVAGLLGRPAVMAALATALAALWWFGRDQPVPNVEERPTDVASANRTARRAPLVWDPPRPHLLVTRDPLPRPPETWRDPSGIAGGPVALQLGIALLARAELLTTRRGRPRADVARRQRRRTSGSRPVLP